MQIFQPDIPTQQVQTRNGCCLPYGGTYDVRVWKTENASSDPAPSITASYIGGASLTTQDFTSGTSGWIDVGIFAFAAVSTGNVTMGYSGIGFARTSMVKFVQQ